MSHKHVHEFTDDNFDNEVLSSKLPVLVHFTAPWCNTCKQLVPIIEEIAEEFQGKVKAGKLDVDVSRLIAERYQIRSLPTCMVFRGGRKTGEVLGLTTRSRLAKLLGV